MCAFAASRSPAGVARAAIVPLLVAAAAVCQAGCATNSSANYAGAPAAVAYAAPVSAARVEIEDDGLPSQAAPAANIRQIPDDPSEPFSRNYGGPNPAAVVRGAPEDQAGRPHPARSPIPADLPPAFRRQLAMAGYAAD